MPIVEIYGREVEFPDDMPQADLEAAVRTAAAQLAPAGAAAAPKPRRPAAPAAPLPTPGRAALDAALGAVRDIGAGAVRGAGSIGSTLVAPGDMLADALLDPLPDGRTRNQARRENIDKGLKSATGARTDSVQYALGKTGGEIAGTLGAAPAIAGRVAAASPRLLPLATAIGSGGMRAGNAGMLTRVTGGAVGGAASAGLVDPEMATTGAVIGGALPPAVQVAGRVGQSVRNAVAGPAVPEELRTAVESARSAGYVIPPTQAKPTLANRMLEGVAGKLTTAQNASARNAEVTNRLVARALGVADDAKITPELLNNIRSQAGRAYDAIGQTGTVVPGKAYNDALDKIVEPYKRAAAGFPGAKPPEIVGRIDELRTKEFDAAAGIAKIRELREMADSAGRAGDKTTARAYKAASEAIEQSLDRHLQAIQAPADMLKAFRDARQLIAKTYTVEKALNPTTGTIDARKIGADIVKGKPISGDLRTVGEFANRFKTAAKPPEQMGSLPQTSPLDWAGFGTASALTSQPLLMAGVAARPATRALLLSPLIQNRLASPQSQGLLSLLMDPEAMALASRATPAVAAGQGRP